MLVWFLNTDHVIYSCMTVTVAALCCFYFDLHISFCVLNSGLTLWEFSRRSQWPGLQLPRGQLLPSTGSVPCPFLFPFLLSYMPQLLHTLPINNLEFYGCGSQINFYQIITRHEKHVECIEFRQERPQI